MLVQTQLPSNREGKTLSREQKNMQQMWIEVLLLSYLFERYERKILNVSTLNSWQHCCA